MKQIELIVKNEKIRVRKEPDIVLGCSDVIVLSAMFSDDWNGLKKTVHFEKVSEKPIDQELDEDGCCMVPNYFFYNVQPIKLHITGEKDGCLKETKFVLLFQKERSILEEIDLLIDEEIHEGLAG